ncbi:MAG: type I secretion system permease/ATPase [Burkholderiaceae bacterium]|nr:type I secretion system permease/ATPase [Burkholderiaceae bacterium]
MIMQSDNTTGLSALLIMAGMHGIVADVVQLQHEFSPQVVAAGGYTADILRLLARRLGMSTLLVRQDLARLDKAPLPALARAKDGRWFVLAKFMPDTTLDAKVRSKQLPQGKLLIQHPGEAPMVLSTPQLADLWTGELLLFTSSASFAAELSRFDFSWFIPAIVKYRRLLLEILLTSLVLQLIGLVTPLFFQVVMDKVLVNHAMKTLTVVAVGLICANIFEAVLSGIRSWVFAHTSSKIDVELGARLFRHLLNLPMAYFEARRVGDSVARVRELENIRSFLTSNAMTLVLDLLFSVVFIGVMLWYSPLLTLVVILSIPVYLLLSIIFTPVIRAKLNDKFNKSAENQSFLVETVSGINTVKALAVEPRWIHRWDQQLAAYVTAGLSASNVATLASSSVTLVSKLVTAGIMWMGASLVIDNQMTVGQLIAFNMLAAQVSNPILRLAQLWNDFQQVGISMSRLGDILNARTEIAEQKTPMPRLTGTIEFDQVNFRYRIDASDVIRSLNLKITPGEVIGIVGRSGSGKSTLAKLVQRLYVPDRGRILVDGQDIAVINTSSLRHQIGVVLQENILFNRSIRDNIALSNPSLPIEVVINAAKLAGAHDFICEMPEGYDTKVGEHGTGLSGGQRQRIAIARALITNPRVLIFDEATSALDYESEAIIQNNMRRICQGRTVLIIAHRLSAVRDADRIIVMERGQIVEIGSHQALLSNPQGIYAHMYGLQQAHTHVKTIEPTPEAQQAGNFA